MQKVNKRYEQKIEAINKIQFNKRSKYGSSNIVNQNNVELPLIVNALTPTTKSSSLTPRIGTLINTLEKKKIESELDVIINDTIRHFKHQKVNRIIFASPLTSRLGKTYYRSSQYKTLDASIDKHNQQQRKKQIQKRREQCELFFSQPLKKSNKIIDQICYPSLNQTLNQSFTPGLKKQNIEFKKQIGSQIYLTSPDEQRMENKYRYNTERVNIRRKQKRGVRLAERFSPWRNDEGNEQLIL